MAFTKTKQENLIEHNPEVIDILGAPPSWLMRYGMSLFFCMIGIMLTLSWVIKYPQVIQAKATLTSINPPLSLLAKNSGKIQRMYVADGETVVSGQLLAILENTANYHHVIYLKERLDDPAIKTASFIEQTLQDSSDFSLGEIQHDYLQFLKISREYTFSRQSPPYDAQVASLQKQLANYRHLQSNLQLLVELEKNELSRPKSSKTDSLHKAPLLTLTNFTGKALESTDQKRLFLQTSTSYIQAGIRISELEKTINDLNLEKQAVLNASYMAYLQSLETLKNRIRTWEAHYVIQSPIKGRTAFQKFWTNNQNVTAQEEIMSILPEEEKVFCQATIPLASAGRVKTGQIVHIKLDNFPYQEFGYITGQVDRISLLPRNESYTIHIIIPDGLKTNYGQVLDFKHQSGGVAEIITQDMRLFDRFFYQLLSLVKK